MRIRSSAVDINQFCEMMRLATDACMDLSNEITWKCCLSWISPRREVYHLEEL